MFGPDTAVIDGQRFALPPRSIYNPQGYGPQTTGVPNASPTLPPAMAALDSASGGVGGVYETVGGYGTATSNTALTAQAAAAPMSLKHSPVLWAVGLLLVSVLLLGKIHWAPVR